MGPEKFNQSFFPKAADRSQIENDPLGEKGVDGFEKEKATEGEDVTTHSAPEQGPEGRRTQEIPKHPTIEKCLAILEREVPRAADFKVTVYDEDARTISQQLKWGDFHAHYYEHPFWGVYLVYPSFKPQTIEAMMDSVFPDVVLPMLSKKLETKGVEPSLQRQIEMLIAFVVFHEVGHALHTKELGQERPERLQEEERKKRKFEAEAERRERFAKIRDLAKIRTDRGKKLPRLTLELARKYRQLPDERPADAFALEMIKKHYLELFPMSYSMFNARR